MKPKEQLAAEELRISAWKKVFLGLETKRFAIQVKATVKDSFRVKKEISFFCRAMIPLHSL